jgi:hypothetical protein
LEGDDIRCRELFRLGCEGIKVTATILSKYLKREKGNGRGRTCTLSPTVQLALFCYYCAHGCAVTVCAEVFGIPDNTAKAVIGRVAGAFDKPDVFTHFVNWPDRDEQNDIAASFAKVRNFPNVVGAIDGTHITVRASLDVKSSYVNRKGWTSLNVTAVCDDQLRIRALAPDTPGAMHDARVFSTSHIRPLVEALGEHGFHVLGDPAYAATTTMLVPMNIERTQRDRNFNFSHSSTRMAIECCFGKLKAQWKILAGVRPRIYPDMMTLIVGACACLHNITIDYDGAGRLRRHSEPVDFNDDERPIDPCCGLDNLPAPEAGGIDDDEQNLPVRRVTLAQARRERQAAYDERVAAISALLPITCV